MNKTILALIATAISLTFSACGSSETKYSPIKFSKSYHELRKGFSIEIPFQNGSGDYSMFFNKDGLVDAEIITSPYDIKTGKQKLVVTGKKEGQVQVLINDNELKLTANISVNVVVPYIGFYGPSNYIPTTDYNQLFSTETILFFTQDNQFYLFKKSSQKPILNGAYGVDGTTLRLNYQEGGKTKTSTFDISKSSDETIEILSTWDGLQDILDDEWYNPLSLGMIEEDTGYRSMYIGELGITIPENVL